MRITLASIKGLFGVFNHVIPFNLDERITIIHAPNGYGKTIVLKMLNGIFNSRYTELLKIPYKNFQVMFEDDSYLEVLKGSSSDAKQQKSSLVLNFNNRPNGQENKSLNLEFDHNDIGKLSSSMLEESFPGLYRTSPREWAYGPTGESLELEEVIEKFKYDLPPSRNRNLRNEKWFNELKEKVSVYLIESQRLLSFSENRNEKRRMGRVPISPSLTVNSYSNELVYEIKERLTSYASVSQSLDRSFPTRVLKQRAYEDLTSEELLKKLEELEKDRSGLIETGLLEHDKDESPQIPQDEIDESMRNILSVYVKDVEEKLRVFDDITRKIDLFRRIINLKFSYKELTISREKGFIFRSKYPDEYENSSGDLSPDSLSSGEQHELVLLYELLFKVKGNSLVLIDEPELSLHVGWQISFLRDLKEISKLVNSDFLIATHSPSIVNGRWDLTVELKNLPR